MYNINLDPGMYTLDQLKFAIINSNASTNTWRAITSEVSQMSAAEVAEVVSQVDGVTFARNAAGDVIGAWYDNGAITAAPANLGAIETAQAINSNSLSVASRTATMAVPENAAVNTVTQAVEMDAGATSVAAGTKVASVLGHIGTWVLGAGIGMKLGVWIDGGLYNLNPDFWDEHNMEYLNPERWTESKVTNWLYDYSGYDDFIGLIDEDGQVYVDENLAALAAQYLASQGAFNIGAHYCTDDDLDPSLFNYPDYVGFEYPYYVNDVPPIYNDNHVLWKEFHAQGDEPVYFFFGSTNETGTNTFFVYAMSLAPFTGDIPTQSMNFTNNEGDYVYCYGNSFNTNVSLGTNGISFARIPQVLWFNSDFWHNDISILLYHGKNGIHSGVEGINPYSTTPTGITDQMTPEQIVQLLKQQYPGLWDDAIKQGVLNDDGTITDRVYIPIALPDGGTDGQPETSPDHPGAPDPDSEPQVKILNKIIQKTPTPTQEPENPDTGTGNTPAVVTPTGSADALYKIYNPTNAQIQSFGAWLWSSNFVDQLLKVFNDPMQAIISLHKIYATPHVGGTANIKVGYLDSGVASKWVDEQYIEVDCGSVNLNEVTASVYDYDPFTQVRLYLPFIGIVTLDTADVMRGKIGVKYKVDVITGTVVATVSVTRDNGAGGVIYQYTGSCCEAYPLSSGSYMGILTGVLGIAASVAGTIATGGAATPALIGGAAGLTAMHTKVEHSNGFSGNAGAMACKKPYLIISRQQTAMSNGIAAEGGYPSNSFIVLNQCKGFTKVKYVHLEGISGATDAEHDQIIKLLKEGVII